MKTAKSIFFSLFLVFAITVQSFCQSDKIVADSQPFQYLIGMKYFNTSELGDFIYEGSGSRIDANGIKNGHTNLLSGEQHIITSEFIVKDSISSKEIHRIVDIVVLNEFVRTCHGCLLTNKENTEVMTIHSRGEKNMTENSILAAFEINYKTGKYKKVNPEKYKWRDDKGLD